MISRCLLFEQSITAVKEDGNALLNRQYYKFIEIFACGRMWDEEDNIDINKWVKCPECGYDDKVAYFFMGDVEVACFSCFCTLDREKLLAGEYDSEER